MLPARYHGTIVLLHVEDGVSPRTLAGRFGATLDEVRAVLIEAGVLNTAVKPGAWRNSMEASQERHDRRIAPAPNFADEDERLRAELRHVNAIIRELRGHGFPFLQLTTRAA